MNEGTFKLLNLSYNKKTWMFCKRLDEAFAEKSITQSDLDFFMWILNPGTADPEFWIHVLERKIELNFDPENEKMKTNSSAGFLNWLSGIQNKSG